MSKVKAFYQNKKILITGGLGFIGSSLAHKLVKFDADVTIIDSLLPEMGGNLRNIKGIENKVKINIADLRDPYSSDVLVREKDIIFNLAGTLSHVGSMEYPLTDLDINCRSQVTFLESCRKFNPNVKIVYSGTRNQYGKAKYLPVDEDHPMDPTDVNGINCIAGESYHILYHRVYGIKSCSLRLNNTYGPRHQMRHSRQGVLNWFIRQIMDGEKINLFGGGNQIRDCVYIDDVVNSLLLAAASDSVWGKVYNVGAYPASLKEFVNTAIKVYGKGELLSVKFPENRKTIEVGDFISDWSRIKKEIGWQPKVNLEQGIKKTFVFYEKNKQYYWN
ncbi:MAG: GDP-mannose 4,6-dehydratase [Saprospiraceae bacterium]|nr:GDP-mannose 4,6-dehydratase [Saprospiraceae bacterium]